MVSSPNAGSQADLRSAVANQTQAGIAPAKKPGGTIKDLLDKMAPQFQRALPKHMDTDRLMRIALTTIRQNPKLLAADQTSLLASLMQCAQLGLEPGILGHAYLVPFRNNKENRIDVQFIVGYKGMVDLARRSGEILSIQARPVYANDLLLIRFGLDDKMEHTPWHQRTDPSFSEPGNLRGVTFVAKFKDGGYVLDYMPLQEIEEHRRRSKSPHSGPWVDDYESMCLKTIVRKNWRWLPVSVEVRRQVDATDETIKREIAADMTEVDDVMDADYTDKGDGSATEGSGASA